MNKLDYEKQLNELYIALMEEVEKNNLHGNFLEIKNEFDEFITELESAGFKVIKQNRYPEKYDFYHVS